MRSFTPQELDKKRNDQIREISLRTDKMVNSLKKVINVKNDATIDYEKMKKSKEYDTWCAQLIVKKSKLLEELNKYQQAIDVAKEDLYIVISKTDAIKDSIIDLREERDKLELQIKWKKEVLSKQ